MGPLKDQFVMITGPGLGLLSREVLRCHPQHLFVNELSWAYADALSDLSHAYPSTHVHLSIGLHRPIVDKTTSQHPPHLIAHLPYKFCKSDVGTETLLYLLHKLSHFTDLTLMLPKEAAERLLALPGDNKFGRLSVLVQFLTSGRTVIEAVPPNAFTPPQQFFSAVIQLQPLRDRDDTLLPYLEQITAMAFQLKRSTLQQSLLQLWPKDDIKIILDHCGLEANCRPTTLTVSDFVSLARQLQAPSYNFL